MAFDGFKQQDFDVYQPQCRTSAMYTLKRRAVKDKLLLLASGLREILGDALAGLEPVYSDEAPSLANNRQVDSQWLSLMRNSEGQARLRELQGKTNLHAPDALDVAAHHRHAQLAVVVDDQGLETSLRIHRRARVDRNNLTKKVSEAWARDALIKQIVDCGAGFFCGWIPDRALPERGVSEVNADSIDALITEGADSEWWVIGARCSVEDAVALGPRVAEACAERLAPLLPIYRFVAWSPDNDLVGAQKAIKEIKASKRKAGHRVGDKVRILAGMWQGRRGIIEDIDKKGNLKVSVGLVSVRVGPDEVASV